MNGYEGWRGFSGYDSIVRKWSVWAFGESVIQSLTIITDASLMEYPKNENMDSFAEIFK